MKVYLTVFISACFAYYADCACPTIISRSRWGGLAPKSRQGLRTNPPPYVVVHHSDTPTCTTSSQCQARVKNIQSHHMFHNGWADIGYNFLIGGDGQIYEGRGWGTYGAHVPKYNSRSIGVCFIGNFQTTSPPSNQFEALKNLIQCGVETGKITSNYHVIGHRQGGATDCPGDNLFDKIKTLPRFDRNPN